jgi:hypothetical protein
MSKDDRAWFVILRDDLRAGRFDRAIGIVQSHWPGV